jgi:hypothetical protein
LVQAAFGQEAAYGPWLLLVERDIVRRAEGGALLRALLALYETPAAIDPELGDPYSNREHELRQRIGEAAGWLGAGRARRESSTVAFALTVRSQLLEVAAACLALLRARAHHSGRSPHRDAAAGLHVSAGRSAYHTGPLLAHLRATHRSRFRPAAIDL